MRLPGPVSGCRWPSSCAAHWPAQAGRRRRRRRAQFPAPAACRARPPSAQRRPPRPSIAARPARPGPGLPHRHTGRRCRSRGAPGPAAPAAADRVPHSGRSPRAGRPRSRCANPGGTTAGPAGAAPDEAIWLDKSATSRCARTRHGRVYRQFDTPCRPDRRRDPTRHGRRPCARPSTPTARRARPESGCRPASGQCQGAGGRLRQVAELHGRAARSGAVRTELRTAPRTGICAVQFVPRIHAGRVLRLCR